MKNIKEKVLKEEIEETKEQLRLIEEEHPMGEADYLEEYDWWVNAIINIKMVERAKLLAEVFKVIDKLPCVREERDGKVGDWITKEELKKEFGI